MVSLNDLRVFLCRLETAMRAASWGFWCLGFGFEVWLSVGARREAASAAARRENTHQRIVRVRRGHGGGRLGGELVQLGGRDAAVDAGRHLLRDEHLCCFVRFGVEREEERG
jgi:hypothetical protein